MIAVVAAATPVPDTEMLAGEFVALLATLTVPETAPAVVGLNMTVKVAVSFGATVTAPMALAVKPVPLVVTPEIVTLEFPLFVRLAGLGASS